MRDPSTLEKDKDEENIPCLEVVASLKLNGYRLRYRRQSPHYVPDPGFRPFFWKDAGGEDGSDGFGDDLVQDQSLGAQVDGAMDVDAAPQGTGSSHGGTASVVQRAITPYNHSSSTPRGKEIVARVRASSPSLVAPPTRSVSPSRVRTFMQGRTCPQSSSSTSMSSPLVTADATAVSPLSGIVSDDPDPVAAAVCHTAGGATVGSCGCCYLADCYSACGGLRGPGWGRHAGDSAGPGGQCEADGRDSG
jgi:hypothetical protein